MESFSLILIVGYFLIVYSSLTALALAQYREQNKEFKWPNIFLAIFITGLSVWAIYLLENL